ncbi:Serine/threonine-protein_phosphatase [Hexamita inflata]|uniref:Serine/threonine-protein phosphatase n=1 Tax=Hexamita inflata TaxID=28002 RepID=A0AA86V1W9_9EUKA|nr:Serine/threonine-protein phosphatase [Hexamita inflata]
MFVIISIFTSETATEQQEIKMDFRRFDIPKNFSALTEEERYRFGLMLFNITARNINLDEFKMTALLKQFIAANKTESTFSSDSKVTIIGDLHGSLEDLIHIFTKTVNLQRFLRSDEHIVFLGDYVDRGANGCKTLQFLLGLSLICPRVHLLRGNHENEQVNKRYGFYEEVMSIYYEEMFVLIQNAFETLSPLVVLEQNGEKNLFVHGGAPVTSHSNLENIIYNLSNEEEWNVLWSDPTNETENVQKNKRGAGVEYGINAFNEFKQRTGVKRVFRGHEVVDELRDDFGDKTHFTVYSSRIENKMGFAAILENGEVREVKIDWVPES